jgi:hypothetical protein
VEKISCETNQFDLLSLLHKKISEDNLLGFPEKMFTIIHLPFHELSFLTKHLIL